MVQQEVEIYTVGRELDSDEMAGTLLVAYLKSAESFLSNHVCVDCPAQKLHKLMVESHRLIMYKIATKT